MCRSQRRSGGFLGNSLAPALQPSPRDEQMRLKPWRSEWPSNESMGIRMQTWARHASEACAVIRAEEACSV
jgi:hypothetical protein